MNLLLESGSFINSNNSCEISPTRLPDHDHGGGVELAVAEQLAADIFTHFWFAGA
jgi:hypothetical protein